MRLFAEEINKLQEYFGKLSTVHLSWKQLSCWMTISHLSGYYEQNGKLFH